MTRRLGRSIAFQRPASPDRKAPETAFQKPLRANGTGAALIVRPAPPGCRRWQKPGARCATPEIPPIRKRSKRVVRWPWTTAAPTGWPADGAAPIALGLGCDGPRCNRPSAPRPRVPAGPRHRADLGASAGASARPGLHRSAPLRDQAGPRSPTAPASARSGPCRSRSRARSQAARSRWARCARIRPPRPLTRPSGGRARLGACRHGHRP